MRKPAPELHGGRYLVTVKDGARADEAWEILHRQGAYNHQNRRAGNAAAATPSSLASGTSAKDSTRPTGARRV